MVSLAKRRRIIAEMKNKENTLEAWSRYQQQHKEMNKPKGLQRAMDEISKKMIGLQVAKEHEAAQISGKLPQGSAISLKAQNLPREVRDAAFLQAYTKEVGGANTLTGEKTEKKKQKKEEAKE